jgi:uncharacterized protein (TIGR03435 family)
MIRSVRAVCVSLLGFLGAASGQAQPGAVRTVPRSFEVASIKSNETGSDARRATAAPGGIFIAENVTLKLLISRAYGVAEARVDGGPGWVDGDKYDVRAKADTPLEMTREELRPCLQALLAERFRLKVHPETRQGAVYTLSTAKNGSKLKEHSGAGTSGISASTESGRTVITGNKITLARLAEYLSGQAGRPVLDRTGLKGEFDFLLEWSNNAASASSLPSVFTALQEQLGLRLDAAKGPIETIVIEHAEKPSAN